MDDLITTSRATQNATLSALNGSNPASLASLISASSDAIRRACGRDFVLADYSEYYPGQSAPDEPIRLRQFPVIAISRVAGAPARALQVTNLDNAGNQRATVQTTADALVLTRVASGLPTSVTLPYADHVTVGLMAAATNALGGGWSASVQSEVVTGSFANWASADLRPLQGAASAFAGGVCLEIFCEIPPSWGIGGVSGWRLDADTGELFGRFLRGPQSLRVDYTAGFASVPDAIQEACVQLTADLYQAGLVNSSVRKATLGPSSIELRSSNVTSQLSGKVALLIAPYVDHARLIAR